MLSPTPASGPRFFLTPFSSDFTAQAFNEPDNYGQSWVHPEQAASYWPAMRQLAASFNLSLVAPCVTSASGASWWLNEWAANCTQMHGEMCQFDYA